MNGSRCVCGYAAPDADELTAHLGEAIIASHDVAPDGLVHAECEPGWSCTCGHVAGSGDGLDEHLLAAFTADGGIGRDGRVHGAAGLAA